MSPKFLIGVGVAFFGVLVLGIAAVVSVTTMSESSTASSQVVSNPPIATASDPAPTPAAPFAPQQSAAATPNSASATPAAQSSAIGSAVTVQDSDIAQLASAVKLGTPTAGSISKEVWARETPVAEKLLNGLCDCDQRNWLKHFVQTGNEAISGSENYYQSVQVLGTLRRSNADLDKNRH
jgi:hypothetical protein